MRGEAISALAANAPRRSMRQIPGAKDAVFVADTLGELGLFYALTSVVLMAGSLLPSLEGHNPVEPTMADAAVITGPNVSSFQEIYDALARAGGLKTARTAETIATYVVALWRDEPARAAQK